MSNELTSLLQIPCPNTSQAATPLKARNPQLENLQNQNQDRKRGPSTPLTPSLIQKNVVKKQLLMNDQLDLNKGVNPIEVSKKPANGEREQASNGVEGSPKSRKTITPLLQRQFSENAQVTPKMAKGIKMAVKDQKKSRLQLLRQSESNDGNTSVNSDLDLSEASSIAEDTPNYKFTSNLIYYKNGYYIQDGDVDDSFYETERENIIHSKELDRVNEVLDFMKLEKQFDTNGV